jgi:GT2 family glycosyltransferase
VVVPFRGDRAALARTFEALASIQRRDGDTLTVVDNGPRPTGVEPPPEISVVHAPERPTSYYARNRGAEGGRGEWLVFLDADVTPAPGILDAYFDPEPEEATGILVGGVRDEGVDPAHASAASRYAHERAAMSQANTATDSRWAYGQTANCGFRREAFESAGGFEESARSGGDADLCFRLRAAGWLIESRDAAEVVHRNRTTTRALVRQRARHGAGAAWLNRVHPGCMPPNRSPGVVWWSIKQLGGAARSAVSGQREPAGLAAIEVVSHWAFEAGRLLRNTVRRREESHT